MSILENAAQGNFNPADVFFVAGFASNLTTEILNIAGQNTIGVNVGSYAYDLRTQVDAAGNIIGVDTGALILSTEELYDKMYGPSGWGPTDWNDKISSVSFNGDCQGAVLTLFSDKEFGGSQLRFTSANHHLGNYQGWNDEVSSYRVSFPNSAWAPPGEWGPEWIGPTAGVI